jgi:hypothetical protein
MLKSGVKIGFSRNHYKVEETAHYTIVHYHESIGDARGLPYGRLTSFIPKV